jgi:hypothetical protein
MEKEEEDYFIELFSLEEDLSDLELEDYSLESTRENFDNRGEDTFNIPLGINPVYPRVFIGDSMKYLQSPFNQSEYVDDNITRTWQGIITTYVG